MLMQHGCDQGLRFINIRGSVSEMGERSSSVVKTGIGFGCCLAMIISWSIHQSVLFALFHGILGWFYVVWYLVFIR
jgi:hypothetical protein